MITKDVRPSPGAKGGAVTPAIDLTGYTDVLIFVTVTINGHVYRRGSNHLVDTPTLAALQAAGAVRL